VVFRGFRKSNERIVLRIYFRHRYYYSAIFKINNAMAGELFNIQNGYLRKHWFDMGSVPGITILIVRVFYIIITMTF